MTVCDISRGAVAISRSEGAPRLTACNGTSGLSSLYREPVTVVGRSSRFGVAIFNAKVQVLLRQASVATLAASASDVDLHFDGRNAITGSSSCGIECSASSNVTLSCLPRASVAITAGIGPPHSGACNSIVIRNGTYDIRRTAGPAIGAGAGSAISALTILDGNITATASTTGPAIGSIAELAIGGGNITAVSTDGPAIGGCRKGAMSRVGRVHFAGSVSLRANTGSHSGSTWAIEAGVVVLDAAAIVARTDADRLFSAPPSRLGSVDLSVLYETDVTTATDQVAIPGFEIGRIVFPNTDLWTVSFRNSTWSKAILVDAAAVRRIVVSVPAAGDYHAVASAAAHTGHLTTGGSPTFTAVTSKRFIAAAHLLLDELPTETHTPPANQTCTASPTASSTPTATTSDGPTASTTPSTTESDSPTHTARHTPSPTESDSPSRTESNTPSASESSSPSATVSDSPSPTESGSPSPTESNTPSASESGSPSATVSDSPSPTASGSLPQTTAADESASAEIETDDGPAGGEDDVGYGKGHTALVVIAVTLSVAAIVIFIVMNRTKSPHPRRNPLDESLELEHSDLLP